MQGEGAALTCDGDGDDDGDDDDGGDDGLSSVNLSCKGRVGPHVWGRSYRMIRC